MLLNSICYAEQRPLWELGVGLGSLYNQHYLGADQSSVFVLPLPYFIYRGKVLSADRSGIKGIIFDSEKLDLRIGLGGSLPVNSKDSDAREGMADLDLLAEIGPTLQYQLYKNDKYLLRADFPVRAAFTLGDKFLRHQGWTTNPRLHLDTKMKHWLVTTTLGVVYSDSRYHGYIYNVEGSDVRGNRPFYKAESGFTGSRFSIGAKRRAGPYFYGVNLRYYNLSGAANANSPLIKSSDYLGVSLYIARILGESKNQVAN